MNSISIFTLEFNKYAVPPPSHLPKEKKKNPYDNSVIIELDWDQFGPDSPDFIYAINELYDILRLSGQRRNILKHIRAFLVICTRMEQYNPDAYIAYSRDNNFDQRKLTRNPFKIKLRTLRRIIDKLEELAWIEHKTGIYYWDYKRSSRFRASCNLKNFINYFNLMNLIFYRQPLNGGIILKDRDKRIIEYEPNEQIYRMASNLHIYNQIISNSKITLAKNITGISYFFDQILTYRIFNHSSFEKGGRFYGGWWVNCKKQDRRNILINGHPTVELDYKANHLYLLYGLHNLDMPEDLRQDPYKISKDIPRSLIKSLFTTSINAKSEEAAWRALRKKIEEDKNLNRYSKLVETIESYRQIINLLVRNHPILKKHLHTERGLSLMFHDSRIAEYILLYMSERGIPCLCIHDSFIVPIDREEVLREAMNNAYIALGLPKGLPPIKRTVSSLLN